MKYACALSALCVVLGLGGSALAEPASPACIGALEQISTAQKALVPFRRPMEMARAHEYGANGRAEACIGSGPNGVDKPFRCRKSQWQAPSQTKDDLAAVNLYHQKRQAFDGLFNQAKQICLLEP